MSKIDIISDGLQIIPGASEPIKGTKWEMEWEPPMFEDFVVTFTGYSDEGPVFQDKNGNTLTFSSNVKLIGVNVGDEFTVRIPK